MKAILTLIAITNLGTIDSHSTNYEASPIEIGGHTWQIEEDYSVSYNYEGDQIIKLGDKEVIIEEDLSISEVK